MLRLTAVLVLACGLATVPGVAAASTVAVDPVTGYAVFTGGAGPNDVTMSAGGSGAPFPGWYLGFGDAAQELTVGAGCVAGALAWCQAHNAELHLGGGDDRFGPVRSNFNIIVDGGPGQDHIQVNGSDDIVSGGSGADWLSVGGDAIGYGYGGGGDDNIRSASSTQTVLSGGSGDDLVYGDRNRNRLSGDAGDDLLILGGGSLSHSDAMGGGGDDVMLAVNPRGYGTFIGGDGRDLIVGRRGGADTVSGDDGRDVIDVSGDAGLDTVDCGPGDDTVYADSEDIVGDDCETVVDGPMPSSDRVDAALARLADAFGVTVPAS